MINSINNKDLEKEIRKIYKGKENSGNVLYTSQTSLFSENQLPLLSENEWQQEYKLIYESYKTESILSN